MKNNYFIYFFKNFFIKFIIKYIINISKNKIHINKIHIFFPGLFKFVCGIFIKEFFKGFKNFIERL